MSAKYWEDHTDAELLKKGWKPIEEWKSCYYHPELDCLLIIYVDGLKSVGPADKMKEAWATITENIRIGEQGPVNHFLSGKHEA